MYALSELNQMTQAAFVAALGTVFEDTPAIAAQTWSQRPFTNLTDLHQRMMTVVQGLAPAEQLALIKAHPDLGSRAQMAEVSVQEQAGVGLDRLTPEEFEQFHRFNERYRNQFGFPFIIGVKNHTKATILAAFEQRLQNSPETERQQALVEIGAIARFRLLERVQED